MNIYVNILARDQSAEEQFHLTLFYFVHAGFAGFRKFEGDMMLKESQIHAAENGLDPTNLAHARGLKRRAQWPGGVLPYVIHPSASKDSIVNSWQLPGLWKFLWRSVSL